MIHPPAADHDSSRLALFWPSAVIWLTVFATFSLPGRVDKVTASSLDSVALMKIVSRGLIIAVLGWVIFSRLRGVQTRRIVASYLPWIAFALWAIVSTAWSPLRGVTLGQAGGQVALIFLSITVALGTRQGKSQFLFQLVAAIALYSAIYGCGAFVLPELFAVDRLSDKMIVHPTALGATASLGAVLVVSLMLTSDWKWVRPLAVVSLPSFAVALVAANNRLSIGLVAFVYFGLIIVRGQSFRLAATAMAVAFLGIGYISVYPNRSLRSASTKNVFRSWKNRLSGTNVSSFSLRWRNRGNGIEQVAQRECQRSFTGPEQPILKISSPAMLGLHAAVSIFSTTKPSCGDMPVRLLPD